jgi:hypothetical protein
MKLGRGKKQAIQHPRRRPTGGGDTSFSSYYSSKRSNVPTRAPASEVRKSPAKTVVPARFRRIIKLNVFSSTDSLAQRFGKVLLASVLIACVVSLLQIDTRPRIVMLSDADSNYSLHSTKDYQTAVTASLRSSLLNSNKITVNTQSVITDLRTEFPEIYDASVVLPLVGHRPTVYIELAQPVLLLKTANQTAAVDSSGRALLVSSDAAAVPVKSQLPILADASTIKMRVGDVVLSSQTVVFVKDIVRQFNAQHMPIEKMVLPAGKEELDVYPKGVKYYVRFNLHDMTSRQQAGTYFAARQQLQKPGSVKPKQYIDVRLIGRVYIL